MPKVDRYLPHHEQVRQRRQAEVGCYAKLLGVPKDPTGRFMR